MTRRAEFASRSPVLVFILSIYWKTLGSLLLVLSLAGCGKKSPPTDSTASDRSSSADRSSEKSAESVRSMLARGQQQLASGDFAGASEIAREILVREPQNAKAMVLAGQASIAVGDIDDGVAMLDAAAEAWPEQSAALYAQATGVLWQQNRFDEAQERFVTLLKKYPGFDDARRGLATLLNRRGFRFDANQQIRVLCRRPGFQVTIDELRCLIVPSRAFYPFAEKPRIDDREWIKSTGELNVARALFGEGDIRDALKVLEASDVLQERHPAAVAFYGQVLLESQQFDQFQDWMVKAEKESQRYPSFWMALGGWALREQQPRQAVRMFAEAILREPGEVASHDRMMQALEAVGDPQTAKAFNERRIEVRGSAKMTNLILQSPDISPEAFIDLADLLVRLGRPFEASHWRALGGMKAGFGMEAVQQASLSRQQLLAAEDPRQIRDQLLCGLDVSQYQLDATSLTASGSASPKSNEGAPELAPPVDPVFVNVASSVGLDFRYVNADPPKQRYFLMHEAVGSGIACFDFDLDGNVDLYVGQGAGNAPQGAGKLPNLLARNLGGRFANVTPYASCDDRGYTLGVTSGDWNQDGFPDLVVGSMTRNRLLINQGDGTFREQPGDPIWDDGKYTSSLAIADVTGDHIPDIVEVNYLDDDRIFDALEFKDSGVPVRFPGPLHFRACPDRIFVGQGDGTLQGQVLKADAPSPGLGLLVTDIDGVIGNEIFVANDMKANHLWLTPSRDVERGRSDESSDFVDAAVARGVAYGPSGTPLACMGIASADFDENGYLDLHITNFSDQWTNQYMQNEEHLFDDLALPFGLDQSTLKTLGFGTEGLDYDNNSTVDLVTGNGHIDDLSHEGTPFEMPTQFFIGDRRSFKLTAVQGDPNYWQHNHLTRGLVTLDWNGDGRTDFAAGDLKEPLALLENRTSTDYHWIQFKVVGTKSERDAIGTLLTLHLQGSAKIARVVQTGDGYMSKNESLISVGLGLTDQIEKLVVRWPHGETSVYEDMAVDRRWLLVEQQKPFLIENVQ